MRGKLRILMLIALFTALTAIGAFIRIPLPYIPITLQVFFCVMSGIILGPKYGALSQIIYVALGLAGAPIFTQGGGPGYVLKPSFGYLIGFILCAYVTGLLVAHSPSKKVLSIFVRSLPGLLLLYSIGVPYLFLVYNLYLGQSKTILWALYWGFVTTIGKDILSLYLVSVLSSRLLPLIQKLGYAFPFTQGNSFKPPSTE